MLCSGFLHETSRLETRAWRRNGFLGFKMTFGAKNRDIETRNQLEFVLMVTEMGFWRPSIWKLHLWMLSSLSLLQILTQLRRKKLFAVKLLLRLQVSCLLRSSASLFMISGSALVGSNWKFKCQFNWKFSLFKPQFRFETPSKSNLDVNFRTDLTSEILISRIVCSVHVGKTALKWTFIDFYANWKRTD